MFLFFFFLLCKVCLCNSLLLGQSSGRPNHFPLRTVTTKLATHKNRLNSSVILSTSACFTSLDYAVQLFLFYFYRDEILQFASPSSTPLTVSLRVVCTKTCKVYSRIITCTLHATSLQTDRVHAFLQNMQPLQNRKKNRLGKMYTERYYRSRHRS